jgi:3-dehydroquinate dehydratase/shikimate dehydrogenase
MATVISVSAVSPAAAAAVARTRTLVSVLATAQAPREMAAECNRPLAAGD